MAPWSIPTANSRTLRRSSSSTALSSSRTSAGPTKGRLQTIKTNSGEEGVSALAAVAKGKGISDHHLIMSSAAGPRMYEIPSFMSVYDMDATIVESPSLEHPPKLSSTNYASLQPNQQHSLGDSEPKTNHPQIHIHQHHESTSTQTSDSTDSSPTTTISTIDSSSLSDPSPSSSPESPVTLVPLSSFSGSSFGLDSFQSLKMVDTNPSRMAMSGERPMTSPSPRKSKNPKSLALNLNSNLDSFQTSEPSSPSFIKPPTLKGRRKPSLLSLNTGAANTNSLSLEPLASPSVPNMLQRRGLKHSISSPQILSTPSFGPSGGMNFGERMGPIGPSRFKESSLAMNTFTIEEDTPEAHPGPQMATRIPGVAVGGDSFDRPHSGEDAKSPSYPEGPILMHEPSVHLYLEPKLEEAMEFDVVINVAREVKNPFKLKSEQDASKDDGLETNNGALEFSPSTSDIPPDTGLSTMSFRTAFETQPYGSVESSPTTPKPAVENKTPEYIHVPWDHNTDVKDELWDLCETIDSRTKEGKRVLVHCQQGASRSATLIIAYHMYKNQELGPNEAYSLAQSKSRWVNPNMSLLFSLNDFKKVIEQKKAEKLARKPVVKHRPTLSADAVDPPSRARGNSTPSASVRDAPSTKPEKKVEHPSNTDSAVSRLGAFDFGFSSLSISSELPDRDSAPWEDLMSPRLTEMTDNPIQNFSRSFGSSQDQPPTSNLFSPRAFEFPRTTYFPPHPQRAPVAVDEDPRSPPIHGEAPITRSIDDFL